VRHLPIVVAYLALLTAGLLVVGLFEAPSIFLRGGGVSLLGLDIRSYIDSAGLAAFPIGAALLLAGSSLLGSGRNPRWLARIGLLSLVLGSVGAVAALWKLRSAPVGMSEMAAWARAAGPGLATFRLGVLASAGLAAAALVFRALAGRRPEPGWTGGTPACERLGSLVFLAALIHAGHQVAWMSGGLWRMGRVRPDPAVGPVLAGMVVLGAILHLRAWVSGGGPSARVTLAWLVPPAAVVSLLAIAGLLAGTVNFLRQVERLGWTGVLLLAFAAAAVGASLYAAVGVLGRTPTGPASRRVFAGMAAVALVVNLLLGIRDVRVEGRAIHEFALASQLTALIAAVFLLSAWQVDARPPSTTGAAEGGDS
jgi:hypothetical protein